MITIHHIRSSDPALYGYRDTRSYRDRSKWLAAITRLNTMVNEGKAQSFSYWTTEECTTCYSSFDVWDGVRETTDSDGPVSSFREIPDRCPECGQPATYHHIHYASGWIEKWYENPTKKPLDIW